MKTKEEKKALVRDTVRAFNSNSRCMDSDGLCRYHVPGKSGCAIGRLIDDKKLCKKLDTCELPSVSVDSVFALIPSELQAYGQPLLYKVQSLHDNPDFWDEKGLSRLGKAARAQINRLINSGKL